MLHKNVAPGIHRIEQAYTNFYVVEDKGQLSIIDCGLPKGWPLLLSALQELKFHRRDIKAIAITHAHFDHLGFAARAQAELDVPIWIHKNESYIARYPYRYDHENNRLLYPLRHPKSLPIIARIIKAGGLRVQGIQNATTYDDIQHLDIPGHPQSVFVPGHTYGHCALYFPDRDALLTGDALVTLSIYTGKTGPQIISGAATADSAQALESLDALAATNVTVVLPGHGEPWTEGIQRAVEAARSNGVS